MKKLLKLTTLFIIVFFNLSLYGQVKVTLYVSQNPNPKLSEWENGNETARMTIFNSNPALEGLEYKIDATLKIDGEIVFKTRQEDMPVKLLSYNDLETFYMEEIAPYSALEIYDDKAKKETVIKTGLLPGGVYDLCVKLVDLQGNTISTSNEDCKPMILTEYQAPELISPEDKAEIVSASPNNIKFSWFPLTPPPLHNGVKYILQVNRIYQGQSATQAFKDNASIIFEENISGLQHTVASGIEDLTSDEAQEYVWSIKPVTDEGEPYIENDINGFALLRTFKIVPKVVVKTEKNITILAGENSKKLKITTTKLVKNGEKYSGTGIVAIDWLKAKVNVEFEDIKLSKTDEAKKEYNLTEGEIKAVYDGNFSTNLENWGINMAAKSEWSNIAVKAVADWIGDKIGYKIPYKKGMEKAADKSPNLNIPIGVSFGESNNDNNQVALTDIILTPNSSTLTLVAAKDVPLSWTNVDASKNMDQNNGIDNANYQSLGFIAENIKFDYDDILFGDAKVGLVQDVAFQVNSTICKFKKADFNDNTNPGCYFTFKDSNFDMLSLGIEATIPKEWMTPKDGSGLSTVTLSGVGKSFDDVIITGELSPSIIKNTGGIVIGGEVIFDLSENTDAKDFPDKYKKDYRLQGDFQGFYGKELSLTLPDGWKIKDKPISIIVTDLIIDNGGASLVASVEPEGFTIKDGAKVAGLSASLDKISITIEKNSLTNASIDGTIVLPISDENVKNSTLGYTASFNKADPKSKDKKYRVNNMELSILPGTINAGFLSKNANIILDANNTTHLKAYVSSEKQTFDLTLNGEFDLNTTMDKIGDVSLNKEFNGLKMSYDKDRSEPFQFEAGFWGNNTGSKTKTKTEANKSKLAKNDDKKDPKQSNLGFKITVNNIGFEEKKLSDSETNLYFKGGVYFDVNLIIDDDLSGKTRIGLVGSIDKDYKPAGVSVEVNSVAIKGSAMGVKFNGELKFFSAREKFGDGIEGNFSIKIEPLDLDVDSYIQFGKTSFNSTNGDYNYWRVEANVGFDDSPIPFATPLAFYSFGGGVFNHMNFVKESNKNKDTPNDSIYTFIPDPSYCGIRAMVGIGDQTKKETFNADVTLTIVINNETKSLGSISFDGDFALGGLVSEKKAVVLGNMHAGYNFEKKIFDFTSKIKLDAGPIQTKENTPISLCLYFNGKSNKWRFLLGTPRSPNKVLLLGAEVTEYLMFGNAIPPPRIGFSQEFTSAFNQKVKKQSEKLEYNEIVGVETYINSGFAFGAGFHYDISGGVHIALGYGVGFKADAGAEFNLSLSECWECSGINGTAGMNGWRAAGNIGVYAGITVNFGKNIGSNYNGGGTKLFSAGIATMLEGEFPNPTYIHGSINGYVEIGWWDYNFSLGFKAGNKCVGGPGRCTGGNGEDSYVDINDISLIEGTNLPGSMKNVNENHRLTVQYYTIINNLFFLKVKSKDNKDKESIKTLALILRPTKREIVQIRGNYEDVVKTNLKNNICNHFIKIKNNGPKKLVEVYDYRFVRNAKYKLKIECQLEDYKYGGNCANPINYYGFKLCPEIIKTDSKTYKFDTYISDAEYNSAVDFDKIKFVETNLHGRNVKANKSLLVNYNKKLSEISEEFTGIRQSELFHLKIRLIDRYGEKDVRDVYLKLMPLPKMKQITEGESVHGVVTSLSDKIVRSQYNTNPSYEVFDYKFKKATKYSLQIAYKLDEYDFLDGKWQKSGLFDFKTKTFDFITEQYPTSNNLINDYANFLSTDVSSGRKYLLKNDFETFIKNPKRDETYIKYYDNSSPSSNPHTRKGYFKMREAPTLWVKYNESKNNANLVNGNYTTGGGIVKGNISVGGGIAPTGTTSSSGVSGRASTDGEQKYYGRLVKTDYVKVNESPYKLLHLDEYYDQIVPDAEVGENYKLSFSFDFFDIGGQRLNTVHCEIDLGDIKAKRNAE